MRNKLQIRGRIPKPTAESEHRLHPQDHFMERFVLWMIPPRVTPNHITLIRFVSVPFVAWLLWVENYLWGFPLFVLSAFTDAIDGSLARTRKQITDWGKLYDPLADKLLDGTVAYILVAKYLYAGIVFAIIFLEFIAILTGWYRKARGIIVQANIWGKIKLNLQVTGICVVLLGVWGGGAIFFTVAWWLLIASLLFSVISLVTYGI